MVKHLHQETCDVNNTDGAGEEGGSDEYTQVNKSIRFNKGHRQEEGGGWRWNCVAALRNIPGSTNQYL